MGNIIEVYIILNFILIFEVINQTITIMVNYRRMTRNEDTVHSSGDTQDEAGLQLQYLD